MKRVLMSKPVGRPLCVLLTVAFVLAAAFLIPAPTEAQLQSEIQHNPGSPRKCNKAGTQVCYGCSVLKSPGNAGCDFGQPPNGFFFGTCALTGVPGLGCTEQFWLCGPYRTCTNPPVLFGPCTGSYFACR